MAIIVVEASNTAAFDAPLARGAIVGALAEGKAAAAIAGFASGAVVIFATLDASLVRAMGRRHRALFVAFAGGLASLKAKVAMPTRAIHVPAATDTTSRCAELPRRTIRGLGALGADPLEAPFSGAMIVPGTRRAKALDAKGSPGVAFIIAGAAPPALPRFAHSIGTVPVPEARDTLPRRHIAARASPGAIPILGAGADAFSGDAPIPLFAIRKGFAFDAASPGANRRGAGAVGIALAFRFAAKPPAHQGPRAIPVLCALHAGPGGADPFGAIGVIATLLAFPGEASPAPGAFRGRPAFHAHPRAVAKRPRRIDAIAPVPALCGADSAQAAASPRTIHRFNTSDAPRRGTGAKAMGSRHLAAFVDAIPGVDAKATARPFVAHRGIRGTSEVHPSAPIVLAGNAPEAPPFPDAEGAQAGASPVDAAAADRIVAGNTGIVGADSPETVPVLQAGHTQTPFPIAEGRSRSAALIPGRSRGAVQASSAHPGSIANAAGAGHPGLPGSRAATALNAPIFGAIVAVVALVVGSTHDALAIPAVGPEHRAMGVGLALVGHDQRTPGAACGKHRMAIAGLVGKADRTEHFRKCRGPADPSPVVDPNLPPSRRHGHDHRVRVETVWVHKGPGHIHRGIPIAPEATHFEVPQRRCLIADRSLDKVVEGIVHPGLGVVVEPNLPIRKPLRITRGRRIDVELEVGRAIPRCHPDPQMAGRIFDHEAVDHPGGPHTIANGRSQTDPPNSAASKEQLIPARRPLDPGQLQPRRRPRNEALGLRQPVHQQVVCAASGGVPRSVAEDKAEGLPDGAIAQDAQLVGAEGTHPAESDRSTKGPARLPSADGMGRDPVGAARSAEVIDFEGSRAHRGRAEPALIDAAFGATVSGKLVPIVAVLDRIDDAVGPASTLGRGKPR